MFEELRADAETVTAWKKLAADVAKALEAAGFTISPDSDEEEPAGPEIVVDHSGDGTGGVFVKWKTSPLLSMSVAKHVMKGELQAAPVLQYGVISTEMHRSLLAIINAAGFIAIDASDDMDPFAIRVEKVGGL
ncbi:hypothetical protein AB0C68_27995 [Streptomyces tendae]|uniref:hypothetical protein n=1 Tax=Streptomyces tendae TaxID=1932 RepID=UPI0033F503AD